jgi:hypothetical protein
MDPNTPELDQNKLDEQACGERINYWLKKYGCTLHGVAMLENGSVRVQVGVQKLPPEILKEIHRAEKQAGEQEHDHEVAENPPVADASAPSET